MPITGPIHTDGRAIDRVLGAGLPVMLVFAERHSATRERLGPILARRYGVCLFAGPGAR